MASTCQRCEVVVTAALMPDLEHRQLEHYATFEKCRAWGERNLGGPDTAWKRSILRA